MCDAHAPVMHMFLSADANRVVLSLRGGSHQPVSGENCISLLYKITLDAVAAASRSLTLLSTRLQQQVRVELSLKSRH